MWHTLACMHCDIHVDPSTIFEKTNNNFDVFSQYALGEGNC